LIRHFHATPITELYAATQATPNIAALTFHYDRHYAIRFLRNIFTVISAAIMTFSFADIIAGQKAVTDDISQP
jgi:hypothetical protein